MINYTSAEKVIPQLPKVILEAFDVPTILSRIYQGYHELNVPQNNQVRCCFYNIVNHKAEICSDVKSIISVTKYDENCDPFSLEAYLSITQDGEVERDCVGNYSINAKLFLASEDYTCSFLPLKYIGNSSYVDGSCCNLHCHGCNETFSVTPQRMINTSFKEGQVCVVYNSYVRDDEGNMKIVDNAHVINYLKEFVTLEYLNERLLRGENIAGVYDRKFSEMNSLYRKARGEAMKRSINYKTLAELTTESFNAIMLKNPKLTLRNERY